MIRPRLPAPRSLTTHALRRGPVTCVSPGRYDAGPAIARAAGTARRSPPAWVASSQRGFTNPMRRRRCPLPRRAIYSWQFAHVWESGTAKRRH